MSVGAVAVTLLTGARDAGMLKLRDRELSDGIRDLIAV
jgi:hypothetical protein